MQTFQVDHGAIHHIGSSAKVDNRNTIQFPQWT